MVADFNHDYQSDFVVESEYHDKIYIFIGYPNGTFKKSAIIIKQGYAIADTIRAVDVNSDGHLDLAMLHSFERYISVVLGNGDGYS